MLELAVMMRRTSGGRSWSDGLCSTGEIEDVEDLVDVEDVEGMADILASYGTSPHRTPTIGFFFFTGRLHRRHRLCAGGRVPGSSFVFSFQRKASSERERDVRGDVRGDVSTM